MKHLIFAILFLSVFSSCKTNPYIEGTVVILNVNTIDAENGLQEDMVVVLDADTIKHVMKMGPFNFSSTAVKIDGAGKYLIPGLWDAHVHFAYIEELAPAMFDLFLLYGITSVRDTGGKLEFVKKWKDRSKEQPESAPRVMIAGPLLDGMPNVYDGSSPSRPQLSVGAGSVDEALDIFETLDKAGVDLIKAYEMLTPDQFKAVAQRAKEKGYKVTGHVPLSMDVITASNSGLNSMEHLRNLEMSCASNSDELLVQRRKLLELGKNDQGGVLRSRIHTAQRTDAIHNQDEKATEAVLQVLKKNSTWQIPTLALSTGMSQRPFSEKEWQDDFRFLPKEIADRWMEGINRVNESEIPQSNIDYTSWALGIVDKINDAEIGILAGTDCPIFFLTPGRSLHEELQVLVKAGLTPLEAIESATVRPAQYFGIENELGLVQEGMIADLILLDENPITDISNTLKISKVIKNGSICDREVMMERLENN